MLHLQFELPEEGISESGDQNDHGSTKWCTIQVVKKLFELTYLPTTNEMNINSSILPSNNCNTESWNLEMGFFFSSFNNLMLITNLQFSLYDVAKSWPNGQWELVSTSHIQNPPCFLLTFFRKLFCLTLMIYMSSEGLIFHLKYSSPSVWYGIMLNKLQSRSPALSNLP